MPTCHYCRRESTAAHYDRIVHNKTALFGPFAGWRVSGRFLIAPGPAGRLTPERLLGMLWEERARLAQVRKRTPSSPENVYTLPPLERFDGLA